MRIAMAKIMLRFKHTISVNLSAVEFTLGWQIIDSKNAFILRPNTDSDLEAMQFISFYIQNKNQHVVQPLAWQFGA